MRDEKGRFMPGFSGCPGAHKGRYGGRTIALMILDKVIAEQPYQKKLEHAIRAAAMKQPLWFFLKVVVPLLPKEAILRVFGEGEGSVLDELISAKEQILAGRATHERLPDNPGGPTPEGGAGA